MKRHLICLMVSLALLTLTSAQAFAGYWKHIWGPTGQVVIVRKYDPITYDIYATHRSTGHIYKYNGTPFSWTKIGTAGKVFVSSWGNKLYGLSPDGSGVWEYQHKPFSWKKVGGAAKTLYGGYYLYGTSPKSGDIWRYNGTPFSWTKVGGPGKIFAPNIFALYGISPDGSGVWELNEWEENKWVRVGGAAGTLYSCPGCELIYATNPMNGEIWRYNNEIYSWTKMGGPGKMFAAAYKDATGMSILYGLSPESALLQYKGVYMNKGVPGVWTKIGGPAGKIWAEGDKLLATNPKTHDLWLYVP